MVRSSGKSFEGFVVHEADGARFFEHVGVAGAVAGVNHGRESSGGCDARREILPVRDCAQAFVEKYKLGGMGPAALGPAAWDALHFEAMALDRDFECVRAAALHCAFLRCACLIASCYRGSPASSIRTRTWPTIALPSGCLPFL